MDFEITQSDREIPFQPPECNFMSNRVWCLSVCSLSFHIFPCQTINRWYSSDQLQRGKNTLAKQIPTFWTSTTLNVRSHKLTETNMSCKDVTRISFSRHNFTINSAMQIASSLWTNLKLVLLVLVMIVKNFFGSLKSLKNNQCNS